MRPILFLTLAILLAACRYPAQPVTIHIAPGAIRVIVEQPLPTITSTQLPTWEPTPTQEIDWQPTAPVFLEAINITEYGYNVRDCNSSDCLVVGRLAPGQRVEYVTSRGRWLEIIWQGSTAYVWDECCVVP